MDLVSATRNPQGLAWIREGKGLVGWGEAARFDISGPERFSRAAQWWSRLAQSAVILDEVERPGSGLTAFASFAFASQPGDSVVIVPKVLIGVDDSASWMTVISSDPTEVSDAAIHKRLSEVKDELSASTQNDTLDEVESGSSEISWNSGTVTRDAWKKLVELVVDRINSGEIDKVVLARDIVGESQSDINVSRVIDNLVERFSSTWVFHIDGLVGATPELLVRRMGDQVTSRVLAGTVRSGGNVSEAGLLAAQLIGSDKDQEEHSYAVASVASVLATHCTDLKVPPYPSILKLANVQHLTTDVSGLLVDDVPALTLAASLHPTAAVCGTPTERALWMIKAIEGLDRGRYAGPVGWMDANGDGEFGIALRCGQLDPHNPRQIRLFAGCGIVAGSHPDDEVAESEAKMLAMQIALES